MTPIRTAATVLLLALLATPAATAHFTAFEQSRALTVGPYSALLEPDPSPPFANTTTTMRAILSRLDTGGITVDVKATLQMGLPDQRPITRNLSHDGTGYLIATMNFPTRGNYTARLVVEDDAGTHAAHTSFEVFPDLPFRIRAEDPTLDVFVGRGVVIGFEVVDPVTLTRKDAFDALDVRVQHWSNDHGAVLSSADAKATRAATGLWRIEHTFAAKGMYHLGFGSPGAGFNYDDVPILHINVVEPPPGAEKESPGPGLALAFGALAVAAFVARRSRPR